MNDFVITTAKQTPELNKAFAAARKEIKNPVFDKFNPQYKNYFASQPTVIDAVMPALCRNGIAVFQDCFDRDDKVEVVTTLAHESGEERTFGPWAVPLLISKEGKVIRTKGEMGAARTYACRTHLMTVLGIAGDEDQDANEVAPEITISEEKVTELDLLIKEVGANKAAFLKVLKVDSLSDLPVSKFEGAKERLEAKRKAS